jgi:hypothetical protein
MRALARLASVVVLGVAVAGCGSGLSEHAAIELEARVDAVRAAAEARSRDGAAAAVTELQATVAALLESGEIDADKANEILAAADGVQNALVLIPTTTVPEDDDHGNGEGKGKGKGGKGKD